jgi:HEAT repeat protein
MGNRELKTRMGQLLRADDFAAALSAIRQIPGRQAVNPLFSFFYAGEEIVRWRAITAMGVVVGQMADTAMESARVVMRRLMWNLNDESGGIGWGSPEAMGEITAVNAALATEFRRILISYIDPTGNYLEHEGLQRGSVWGVGRLAHARPDLARPAAAFLPAFFDSPDPYLRGTAIWAAGPILASTMRPLVRAHLSDNAPLRLYRHLTITQPTVAELAEETLADKAA